MMKKVILPIVLLILIYLLLLFTIKDEGMFGYITGIYINILIYIIFAVSLNITVGFMGQLNLGHAGFIAIGAYTSALITKYSGPYYLSILIAGLLAGLFGIIVCFMTIRLKGDYLAIITLAFGEMVRYIVQNISFLGGAAGFKSIPYYANFTNTYIITCISVIILIMLMLSKYGRAILSIREDEIAAENIGVNINRAKLIGFFLSAFFAGVGGSIFAHSLGLISPDKFSYVFSIDILVMVVFGGIGSITGAIMSATFLTTINEFLRQASEYRALIYSLVLIAIMIFRPEGLLGKKELNIFLLKDKIRGKLNGNTEN